MIEPTVKFLVQLHRCLFSGLANRKLPMHAMYYNQGGLRWQNRKSSLYFTALTDRPVL